MIIDAHAHLGTSRLSDLDITGEDLLAVMDAHGVDMALVMPHAVNDDAPAAHDRVARLCASAPTRFRGVASLSPLLTSDTYREEIRRCVEELGFVAVKLNPLQHLASPIMAHARKVFEVASDLAIPAIVHTGFGGPWTMPSLCIPVARAFPDLTIVLAHAGFGHYVAEAWVAAGECPNIVLEPSWCSAQDVRWLVRELGAERVMFGSDHPDNVVVELAKYKSAGLADDDLDLVLGGTAARVFLGTEQSR